MTNSESSNPFMAMHGLKTITISTKSFCVPFPLQHLVLALLPSSSEAVMEMVMATVVRSALFLLPCLLPIRRTARKSVGILMLPGVAHVATPVTSNMCVIESREIVHAKVGIGGANILLYFSKLLKDNDYASPPTSRYPLGTES